MVFEKIQREDYEQIVYCNDPKTGLKAIISMHSTVLGPATGGCRMWAYKDESEALTDVLRLSKGMTYKNAISGLNWGGGKAVIIGDSKTQKSRAMLERYGEYVARLGGNYITAKDVGISSDDLRIVKSKTKHVLGIDGEPGSSGDPSPATAWGVYHGMRAAVKFAHGANSMSGMKIALQGLGSVSYALIEHLLADGAKVIGCDIDQSAIDRATKKFGIETVSPDKIYDVQCDIFSPSALGASINAETLPRIHKAGAKIIAGAANNQLATADDGHHVQKLGMIYCPDYAINAGGVINIYYEGGAAGAGGYSKTKAFEHVSGIEKTVAEILGRAHIQKVPTHVIADRMAEERIEKARQGQK
jgi:leucine dehydrogenase